MGIATLIAAGRLEERLIGRARDALSVAGIAVGSLAWIDHGNAADLHFAGDPVAALLALNQLDDVDVAVRAGERVTARLFVADMDSTMIGQECIDELADYAGVKEAVAAITERAMQGELDFAGALAERVALLKDLDQSLIAECRRERIRPNPGAETLVATLKHHGALTILVSGGFTDFVAPIGEALGFDRIVANLLGVDGKRLTGATVGAIVDAQAKRQVAQAALEELNIDAAAMVAIGDGANDIPMVELAGFGVGYRPKTALAEIANAVIRYHDLTALLWMQGIPRRDWIS